MGIGNIIFWYIARFYRVGREGYGSSWLDQVTKRS